MFIFRAVLIFMAFFTILVSEIPKETKELLVVVSNSWNSSKGTLYRFERVGSDWEKVSNNLSCYWKEGE